MLHENIKQENLILGVVSLRVSHFLRRDHLWSESWEGVKEGEWRAFQERKQHMWRCYGERKWGVTKDPKKAVLSLRSLLWMSMNPQVRRKRLDPEAASMLSVHGNGWADIGEWRLSRQCRRTDSHASQGILTTIAAPTILACSWFCGLGICKGLACYFPLWGRGLSL